MRLFAVMVWPLGQVHESKLRGLPPHGGDAGVTLVGVNVEPSLEKNPMYSMYTLYTMYSLHCVLSDVCQLH